MTSLWMDDLGGVDALKRRPELRGELDVDVAIVGGGYTGLWSAYYLAQADPSLRIVVVEREYCGFGASGRNGGWCVGEFAGGYEAAARLGGHEGAVAMMREVFAAVDEVGRVCAAEGIVADFRKGGTVRVARSEPELERQSVEVAHYRELGFGPEVIRVLSAAEADEQLRATNVIGGVMFEPSARIHPAKLVRGLAEAVERRGVAIYENSAVTSLAARPGQAPNLVVTDQGVIRARYVVRATEAYSAELPGSERDLVPLYSLIVATEPLDDAVWDRIGLPSHATFADGRLMIIYGQRTADGRIAFGGRGAPYLFGSAIDPQVEASSPIHDRIEMALRELLPGVAGAAITHRWGGVLGVPRNWFPSVAIDDDGMVVAGGYVGEGVAMANLAGRTVTDLVRGELTVRTTLPWVNNRSRRWPPEPFRWAAIRSARAIVKGADAKEARTGREAKSVRVVDWLAR